MSIEKQSNPQVAIIMGSDSDFVIMKITKDILDDFGIEYEVKILSAHRSPDLTSEYAKSAEQRGIKVIIAAAGGAAHLAGVLAANTILPVIGVPIPSKDLKGIDSLLSTVQMPGGVPVATMGIGESGAKNAGIFAVNILASDNDMLSKRLKTYKKILEQSVKDKETKLNSKLENID